MAAEKSNHTLTIPAGQSVTTALDVGYHTTIAAYCTGTRDGTHLMAEMSPDGVTWSALTGTLAAFDADALWTLPFGGLQLCRWVRLRSCDSGGVPVEETAALPIKVVLSNANVL